MCILRVCCCLLNVSEVRVFLLGIKKRDALTNSVQCYPRPTCACTPTYYLIMWGGEGKTHQIDFFSFIQMIFINIKFQQSVVRFRKYQLSIKIGSASINRNFGLSYFLYKSRMKHTHKKTFLNQQHFHLSDMRYSNDGKGENMCTGHSLDGVLLTDLYYTWSHFIFVLVTNHKPC